jgi:hypothetical protein
MHDFLSTCNNINKFLMTIRNIAIMDKSSQEYHHLYHHNDSHSFFVCSAGKEKALYILKLDDARYDMEQENIKSFLKITQSI